MERPLYGRRRGYRAWKRVIYKDVFVGSGLDCRRSGRESRLKTKYFRWRQAKKYYDEIEETVALLISVAFS